MAYTPTVWKDGDIVTSTRLNKIENAIEAIAETPGSSSFDFSDRMAKGVDDNGNEIKGAIIEGCIEDTEVTDSGDTFTITKNKATGMFAHAEGATTTASGDGSHAEGSSTTASGVQAHTEGGGTTASGQSSHAEGQSTIASDVQSHAEGFYTIASGASSHASGSYTVASGAGSHTEGNYINSLTSMKITGSKNTLVYTYDKMVSPNIEKNKKYFINRNLVTVTELDTVNKTITIDKTLNENNDWTNYQVTVIEPVIASGSNSHAEGMRTIASGPNSHTEGQDTIASGPNSHTEGQNTTASAAGSHAEGGNTIASGVYSHAEGQGGTFTINNVSYTSEAKGVANHTEGYMTRTSEGQPGNHAEGYQTAAIGGASHAEGYNTTASGVHSHAEGSNTIASSYQSHAEGSGTTASHSYSHAEGSGTIASGQSSHAEGYNTKASGAQSHAEGGGTTASGGQSHAEGSGTKALGNQSHAEGNGTTASGYQSHAEGNGTTASGYQSHAEGNHTIANHESQHVFGEFNIADPSSELATHRGTYVEIVGNGTAYNARSNARTLDWSGNETLAGSLTLGDGTNDVVTISAAQLKNLLTPLIITETYDESTHVATLNMTWQQIYDAFVSGRKVFAYTEDTNYSGYASISTIGHGALAGSPETYEVEINSMRFITNIASGYPALTQ